MICLLNWDTKKTTDGKCKLCTVSHHSNSGTVEELLQDLAFLTIYVTMRPIGNNMPRITQCIGKVDERISPG